MKTTALRTKRRCYFIFYSDACKRNGKLNYPRHKGASSGNRSPQRDIATAFIRAPDSNNAATNTAIHVRKVAQFSLEFAKTYAIVRTQKRNTRARLESTSRVRLTEYVSCYQSFSTYE